MRKKPKVRYVDMAIYIDAHIYEKDHDVEFIFEYLQCLFYALAAKKRFFYKEEDYDKYSLYSAAEVYMRLTSERQFLPEDDPRKIKKIKSVLNYIKNVLYPMKVKYQKENFNEVYKEEFLGSEVSDNIKDTLTDNVLKASGNPLIEVDVEQYFKTITKTIKNFLYTTPYSNDPYVFKNLYMSCVITLLRAVTLSNANKEKLYCKDTGDFKTNIDNTLDKAYYEEALTAPTAWHLEKDMETYVAVLVNKIKKLICEDIRSIINYYEPSEEVIKNVLMSTWCESVGEDDE